MDKTGSNAYDPQRQAADMFAWLLMTSVPASILGRLGVEAYRTTTNKTAPNPMSGNRLSLDMPKVEQDKEAMTKAAGMINDLHNQLSNAIYNVFVGKNKDSFFSGGSAKTPGAVPWLYGVGVPAGLATGAAGWMGTDKLIGDVKRRERQSDKDAAKEEYERLLQLAVQAKRPKNASALDALATVQTKEGTFDNSALSWEGIKERGGHYGGGLTSALLAMLLITGGLSGKYMWDKTKRESSNDLLSEAQRVRALQQQGTGIPMHIAHTEEEDR